MDQRVLDRSAFESLLRRRMFFTESFEIYRKASNFVGDNRGLYDYGPPGCSLQANIIDEWRKHFVLEEDMLEIDCSIITPEDVFKTSGHLDKFADWMCKDPIRGEYLRADHLIETALQSKLQARRGAIGGRAQAVPHAPMNDATVRRYEEILSQINDADGEKLAKLIEELDIRNPNGNNKLLPPVPFNLMFRSSIGPSSAHPVYLRPETAQGQFLNFRKLLEYNNGIMPFASASVGKSFRNEVSPRSGLLRVREFLMAEIEHFVDPQGGKPHPRFNELANIKLPLLSKAVQLAGGSQLQFPTLGEAVQTRVIDNETLGYFLARIHAFLIRIGIDLKRMRFRQHLPNEMAHYAVDCWDAELLTSYGWIECVGCADRSAYDLTHHMTRTGEKLMVSERLPDPYTTAHWAPRINQSAFGQAFRTRAKHVEAAILELDQGTLETYAETMSSTGYLVLHVDMPAGGVQTFQVDPGMLSIERVVTKVSTREYVPNIIEPSFGIGRILYSLLEHVYWTRPGEDRSRGILSLPINVAPFKVLLVPLSTNQILSPFVGSISRTFRRMGIAIRTDASGTTIGKRYARNDELGTPLGVTIDFQTVKDGTVTLRERDSMHQVRGHQDLIVAAVKRLIEGEETWKDVSARLPSFSAAETEHCRDGALKSLVG